MSDASAGPLDIVLCGAFGDDERAAWLTALAQALPEARWWSANDAPPRTEFAVVANPPPGALQRFQHLRLIQSLWAGVDRLLADTTVPHQVPIARMVDPAMSAAMAETALWAVLGLHRGFFAYAQQQRDRLWHELPQRRAQALRVSVLGLGAMGRAVARRLVQGGYRVAGWSLHAARDAPPGVARTAGAQALPALLAASDIGLNLLPLTSATRGLIDAGFLAQLPPGAGLVNLARGAHVVDADLLAALDAGRLQHAVLDVFHTEPLPAEHAFWRHPRVTVLPHAAALTDARSAAQVVARNLRGFVRGEAVANLVERTRGY